jgi:RNA polymerase sigma-70 factor (ECF subfamily)
VKSVESQADFRELIRRVRAGDPAAAAELVRGYEKEVRRAIRVKLTDPQLRRTFDSMDVCQSVLGNFFVRAAAGQFDLDRPEELVRLLLTMARNKLRDKARHDRAERRDGRRVESGSPELLAATADPRETPSQEVAGRELLEEARRLLSDEERFLAGERARGRSWPEIAAAVGGDPEALRKQLARAMDRVLGRLGLDELRGRDS